MQCLLLKKHLFISQHEVGEQCLDSCKNKSLITLQLLATQYAMVVHRHCVSCFRNSIEGEEGFFFQQSHKYFFFFFLLQQDVWEIKTLYSQQPVICATNHQGSPIVQTSPTPAYNYYWLTTMHPTTKQTNQDSSKVSLDLFNSFIHTWACKSCIKICSGGKAWLLPPRFTRLGKTSHLQKFCTKHIQVLITLQNAKKGPARRVTGDLLSPIVQSFFFFLIKVYNSRSFTSPPCV